MDKCFYCDNPAVRYCDFAIGNPIGRYERVGPLSENRFRAYVDIEKLAFTCDMPMCKEHAKQVGHFHISGKDPVHETIDYCPEHVGGNDGLAAPCTEEDAAALRRAVRAQAARKMIREGNIVEEPAALKLTAPVTATEE